MVRRCMPDSDHEGPPGTRFMTIFGSYARSHFFNTGYFDVYVGIYQCLPAIAKEIIEIGGHILFVVRFRISNKIVLGKPIWELRGHRGPSGQFDLGADATTDTGGTKRADK